MGTAQVKGSNAEVVARQNTTIEGLAEAIENMCLAMAASFAAKQPPRGGDASLAKQVMDTARSELRIALRAYVAPHLRLIEGGGHQGYEPTVPKDNRVRCGACDRDRICADQNCPNWHKAIRAAIKETADDEPDNVA